MKELNTELPTSVELCGKSKWEVERHPVHSGSAEHVWCACNSEDIEETHRHFPTWREALAYADHQARTVEVVLPRGPYEIRSKQNIYEEPIKVEPIKHFPGHETVAVKYTAHGVPAGFFLAPDELRPLALALLALHYHQEVTE